MDVFQFIESMKDCEKITCDGVCCPDCPVHHPEKDCVLGGLIDCVRVYKKPYMGILTIGDNNFGIIDYRIPKSGEIFLAGSGILISDGTNTIERHILEEIE